jgi:hypothetical protein
LILKPKENKKRIEIYENMIEIIILLFQENNYSTAYSIFCGIDNTAVARIAELK